MDLDKKWFWKSRVLDCRVRPETGNPAGDDLRERLAALTGVPLADILASMKAEKMQSEKKSKGTVVDYEKEKKIKEVLKRTHIVGAANLALQNMKSAEAADASSKSKKNIFKAFTAKPKSPSKRIVMDALRETGKSMENLLTDAEEQKAAALRLEKKLAKARLARKGQLDDAAKGEEAEGKVEHVVSGLMGTCLPEYNGDLFSQLDHFPGILYLSRMPYADHHKKPQAVEDNAANTLEISSNFGSDEFKEGSVEVLTIDSGLETDFSAKLYCAVALCNWSRNPANASRLASEGAIKAIMTLCNEPEVAILKYCAGAFRFMSEQPALISSMIDDGVVRVIADRCSLANDFITSNFAIALVNLSRASGKESSLIDQGLVAALITLMKGNPEIGPACCRGIYNLTCVDAPFQVVIVYYNIRNIILFFVTKFFFCQFIEKVISSLSEISTTGSVNIKHICSAAICNLSDLPSLRLKMIESNLLPVLNVLIRGSDLKTRRVCAVILQNFSASGKCRVEMVIRNCVQTMYNLSSDNDPVILRCIGVALSRLALDPSNCTRIVNDGGTMALCNIAVKYASVPVISLPTAQAFHLLSSRSSTRITIAQEGSIVAISSLLKNSKDQSTLQRSLLSLSNLLIEPETHLVIMQQGLIGIMCSLGNHEDETIRDLVGLAFVNLSLSTDSHKHIIVSGGVATVISLSKKSSLTSKRRAAAVIMNMSSNETGAKKLVGDGVISALAELIHCNDVGIVRYTCASLCRLCSSSENCELITKSGAVTKLVERTISGDSETKKYCGSTFTFLSFYESCRVELCNYGVFDALRVLASEADEYSRQRCLAAFGNLSCQPEVQLSLVENGIVSIIANLSNSYQEHSLLCCAKALCNLATRPEARLQIVRDGGAQALMMIGMVKSSDLITKTVCVTALANLIDETTVGNMVYEGIVQTLSNLCKQPDPKSPDTSLLKVCIESFNMLSVYNEGSAGIAERSSMLVSLFNTYECSNNLSKIVCAHTVANLTLCEVIHSRVLEAGALRILEQGIILEDEEAALHCLNAIFISTCTNSKYRELISRSQIPIYLLQIVSSGEKNLLDAAFSNIDERRKVCVRTLSVLAWHENSRTFVQQTESIFTSILNIVIENVNGDLELAEPLVMTLTFLAIDFQFFESVDTSKIAKAIYILSQFESSPVIFQSLITLMRELSKKQCCIACLATAEAMTICERALRICAENQNIWIDIAALLYALTQSGPEQRIELATSSASTILNILVILSNKSSTFDLALSILTGFSLDMKTRQFFILPDFPSVISKVLTETSDSVSLFNAISCAYSMSKIPLARDLMMRANIENILTKIPVVDKPEIKANISRTVKNLASEAGESIEEGTVSSLIAMSLEGKKAQLREEVLEILIPDQNLKYNGEPRCISEQGDFRMYGAWKVDYEVKLGGSTGKGAAAPDPPAMESESSDAYSSLDSQTEDAVETEGKTKMAFAKMQVPEDLRSNFKLTDDDFKEAEESLRNQTENSKAEEPDNYVSLPNEILQEFPPQMDIPNEDASNSSLKKSKRKNSKAIGGGGGGGGGGSKASSSASTPNRGSPEGSPKLSSKKLLAPVGNTPKESPTGSPTVLSKKSMASTFPASAEKVANGEKILNKTSGKTPKSGAPRATNELF
jgi:hypothetical protein